MDVRGAGDDSRVTIEPKYAYGLRTDVVGNIHFNKNQDVIYPVEGVIAFHDYVNNKQTFLKLPSNMAPSVIAINNNRTFIAIVEVTTTVDVHRETTIVLYDLISSRRHKSYPLPVSANNKKVTQLSFVCDSNAVAVLTEYPHEMLYLIYFNRDETVLECRAGNSNLKGKGSCLACNPQNPDVLAIAGDGFMKYFGKTEKGLFLQGSLKPDDVFTSIAWISSEMYFVGTAQGKLILFEKFDKKTWFDARKTEMMDLTIELDCENLWNTETVVKHEEVVCMTGFAKGLAYAIFNQVYVYERISKYTYERKTIIDIPMDNYAKDLYQITNLAINPRQDTVIVTAKHSQIYVGVLIVPESLKTKRLMFRTLGELIHIDEIIDVSVCLWRPILVTSSKDLTVRVWNYQTEKVELVKHFSYPIGIIELYASGQYVVIGFMDSVKIMQIFMDDMKIIKSYPFAKSMDIKFSFLGHYIAIAYGSNIAMISSFNFEILKILKAHSGTVLTVAWTQCDKYIFSGGDEGAIYRWDINTGTTVEQILHPEAKYTCLCIPNHLEFFYAATNLGTVRQIEKGAITSEVKMPDKSPVQDLVLTNSNLIMFAGTKKGYLCHIHLPFSSNQSYPLTKYPFFESSIRKLRFTHDGSLLISCSTTGTLLIWQLKNTEGKLTPIDQDLLKSQEVLIPRKVLLEKLNTIKLLEDKLKQQAAEFYNKQSQSEQFDQLQMANIHKGYCVALIELKNKNKEIGLRHVAELTQITQQIEQLKSDHTINMDKFSVQYAERMLLEYKKFGVLREHLLKLRDDYEEKLNASKIILRDTVKALEDDFQKQLGERQKLIRELMKDMENKKEEFITYCRQTEIDNDRKMIDCQIEYEKKVKFERDETNNWRKQADNHELKYNMVRKESDMLLDEASKLKEQHAKAKANIAQLREDIKDLQRDVADRDHAIRVKEHRIDEILRKNKELAKYKLVLNHKITELKNQIEPREMQIVEKRKQITEMDTELSGLSKNNLQLELQLKELKDKYLSASVERKIENGRLKSARLCITNICAEIYQVAQNMNKVHKLREGIKFLFQKYSADDALKKFVSLDTQAQADLNRQRMHIEKIMNKCKLKIKAKSFLGKARKLKKDNKILAEELQSACRQAESLKSEIKNMEMFIDILNKTEPMGGDITDLDILIEPERVYLYFQSALTKPLKTELKKITDENDKLAEDIQAKRKLMYAED